MCSASKCFLLPVSQIFLLMDGVDVCKDLPVIFYFHNKFESTSTCYSSMLISTSVGGVFTGFESLSM